MRYMLLMCGEEGPEDDPVQTITATAPAEPEEPCWLPWAREMDARGVVLLDGAQLQPARSATTVRADGTEVLVADGPFAETKEQILGYNVIECADLDEAIYVASRHPVARNGGVVEVRPILAS
ncbi:MAG: YciI family protein [Streptosporangiaceae bacterium]